MSSESSRAAGFSGCELPMPALLTIQSGINQLRYATLKGIMAAKKKRFAKSKQRTSGLTADDLSRRRLSSELICPRRPSAPS